MYEACLTINKKKYIINIIETKEKSHRQFSCKGCPAIGHYGSNCSIPCPDINCQYCHMETGTCEDCKAGYQGQRCESGKYCFMNLLSLSISYTCSVIHNRLLYANILISLYVQSRST